MDMDLLSKHHRSTWKLSTLVYLIANILIYPSDAFLSSPSLSRNLHSNHHNTLHMTLKNAPQNRRSALEQLVTIGGGAVTTFGFISPSEAKVEGYAPPPKKSLSEEYRQGTAALADTDEAAIIPKESYIKLPSGVIYADIRPGNPSNGMAEVGKKCNIQWVLRKSNGYFVDSSEVNGGVPFIFTVGDDKGAIKGLDEAIRGMTVGGTRRILMPPRLAYVEGLEDGKPGPVPVGYGPRQQMRRVQGVRKDVPGEYVFLEVQLTRVR